MADRVRLESPARRRYVNENAVGSERRIRRIGPTGLLRRDLCTRISTSARKGPLIDHHVALFPPPLAMRRRTRSCDR
eukprot:3670254-Pleurochrysis_carterae.AAC.1